MRSAAALILSAVMFLACFGTGACAGGLTFTSEILPCTEGKHDGRVYITITGGDNGINYKTFYVSVDGGKKFQKVNSGKVAFQGLSEGSMNICVKDTHGDITPISCFYVPGSSDQYPVSISAESYSEKISGDARIKVHINNHSSKKKYQISTDSGETWIDIGSANVDLVGLYAGTTSVCVREKKSKKQSAVLQVAVMPPSHGKKKYIKTDMIFQNPELPTGCEITSLTMLLNYIGFDVDKLTMADEYLPKGEYAKSDFNEVFVGDPRNVHAFGCFSVPIEKAARDYLNKYDKNHEWEVKNITGCSPDSLYAAIDMGYPVVVWASGGMRNISAGRSWVAEDTGKTLVWPANEHCLLLTGYDTEKKLAYFNDPMVGIVGYDMARFEEMFVHLNRNAVVIVRKGYA